MLCRHGSFLDGRSGVHRCVGLLAQMLVGSLHVFILGWSGWPCCLDIGHGFMVFNLYKIRCTVVFPWFSCGTCVSADALVYVKCP
jgi:hypothetical protein